MSQPPIATTAWIGSEIDPWQRCTGPGTDWTRI